jgi:copper chaperone NosL
MSHTRLFFMTVILCVAVAVPVFGQQKDAIHPDTACRICGMDLKKFAFSRMLLEFPDGSSAGVCSLHCAALEIAVTLDKSPKKIKVVDLETRQFIDAEKAFWVIGGNRPGVMSKRGKWAFENKEDAEVFMRKNKGKLVSFKDAIKGAYEDIYEDTIMIREKRDAYNKMKKQEEGQRP